jgi:hypothetical protein
VNEAVVDSRFGGGAAERFEVEPAVSERAVTVVGARRWSPVAELDVVGVFAAVRC